ncbi:stage II sporulation protein M [Pseudomonas oligotrophica]|uniref:stage II sporulation protein M n=1 Tax=Pseudomonas oligotrophica TaxID=2912055 RepID=UPI001F2DFF1B|nr:stage II sporulation protein M [Pseudomonas oligotrophica]MCF7203385.1 stage II sporulation protein M [Pseudomonas oligotrophica]
MGGTRQAAFEAQHAAHWEAFAARLAQLSGPGRQRQPAASGFVAAYRQLCQLLALAEARGYSEHLQTRLRQLVLAGHQQLYRHHSPLPGRLLGFVLGGFPALVRRQYRAVLLASALFYGCLLLCGLLIQAFPDLVFVLLPADQVAEMEQMYDPDASRLGRFGERGSADDWAMFGFYVMNNIGIAFQTFASGLLLGLGSLFFLVYNGLVIGAVAGHLTAIGYGQPFWSFVVGHGAFELTAITLAGAAGLGLGRAVVAPGRLRRGEALRQAAAVGVRLLAGAALMLLLAAFIEAYWSSMSYAPATLKYLVGGLLWLLVLGYFRFAGRSPHAPD